MRLGFPFFSPAPPHGTCSSGTATRFTPVEPPRMWTSLLLSLDGTNSRRSRVASSRPACSPRARTCPDVCGIRAASTWISRRSVGLRMPIVPSPGGRHRSPASWRRVGPHSFPRRIGLAAAATRRHARLTALPPGPLASVRGASSAADHLHASACGPRSCRVDRFRQTPESRPRPLNPLHDCAAANRCSQIISAYAEIGYFSGTNLTV